MRNFFRQQSPGHSTHGAAEQSWNLGCRLDAVAVVFGEFGNVYNLVSVNSPVATEHMVLQSKTGLCDADKLCPWTSTTGRRGPKEIVSVPRPSSWHALQQTRSRTVENTLGVMQERWWQVRLLARAANSAAGKNQIDMQASPRHIGLPG